jgi:stage II sporulation protein R
MLRKHIRCGAVAIASVLCLMLAVFGQFAVQCDSIRNSVVRLHIMANSDSPEDQALKLAVRDAVTKEAAGLLDGVTDTADALETARAALPRLVDAAQRTVYACGYDYPVSAELCRMYFETRTYGEGDTVTLPAGLYDAVRFTIGEGQGKNWWCVVFPPLCVAAATEVERMDDVLDEQQNDIVTHADRYEVRFKVVEWWESLFK